MPKPGDQGNEGSCVGWAVGYAARSYYSATLERRSLHSTTNIPSPAYIYNSVISTPGDCASGTGITLALDLLKAGSTSLHDFPYRVGQCERPSIGQQERATDFRIKDWRALDYTNVDQVKGELAKGNPVMISIRSTDQLKRLGRGQIYDAVGAVSSRYHALSVVGYDENRQAFKVLNSWGDQWADHGYGWISYRSIANEVEEAYVMVPTDNQPSPQPAPASPPPGSERPAVVDFQCSDVKLVNSNGEKAYVGFLGSDADQATLAATALRDGVKLKTEVRPWPQCEVLLTLRTPLAQRDRPTVKIENARDNTDPGNFLEFAITTPSYRTYVTAVYIEADGSAVTLFQPDALTLSGYEPHTTFTLGDTAGTGAKYPIGPPFGREMLVVVTSPQPLFQTPIPQNQTEREFLTALRQSLVAGLQGQSGGKGISAGYDTIETTGSGQEPRSP